MNIFYLDTDPVKAAQMNCDKHVVKMILECAQLLSTAHRFLDGVLWVDDSSGRKIKKWKINNGFEEILYKATHINHPSAIWARENVNNYNWLYNHFIALCDEYTYRYGKVHLTDTKLRNVLCEIPENISTNPMSKMPQAMPDYCKDADSVKAYRNYYLKEKAKMLNYTKRKTPSWVKIL